MMLMVSVKYQSLWEKYRADLFAMHFFASEPAQRSTLYRKVVTMWQTQPHYTLKDLGNIKARTLIMAGEFDVVRHGHINQLSKAIPGSQQIIIEGATHRLLSSGVAADSNVPALSFSAYPRSPD